MRSSGWLIATVIAASLAACSASVDTGPRLRRNSGTGNSEPAKTSCGDDVDPLVGQRLTKLEYDNVIRDLFGLTGTFSDSFSDPVAGTAGFTTESTAQNVSASIVYEFYRGAQSVADAVFARNPNPLLSCGGGDDCAKKIIADLAPRAYRRPLAPDEESRLFALYQSASANGTFADAMKSVVTGILLAPQFLFRTFDTPASAGGLVPLAPWELASRLSFFLWGSIPDDALRAAAADGSLTKLDVLRAQTTRMLKDPKASYLDHFARQWLELDGVATQVRSTDRFPQYDDAMRRSMIAETSAFMTDLVASDRSVMDIVDGKYTFVDANVSKIYGLQGSFASLTRTPLPEHRAGLLTQPAILTLTSAGDATSVVRRGKWVLEKILCSAPPPPPPDVPMSVAEDPANAGESHIRQRMDQHRKLGASCIGCHATMDPIGLTFENFDSLGYFRSSYLDGTPVDATGALPSGEQLSSVTDLAQLLAHDPRFPSCFTARLTSFASGQDAVANGHRCVPNAVAAALGESKTFSEVLLGIVTSELFLSRASQAP